MPPSTVFSYLRRDHRRPPSPPPAYSPHPPSPSASSNNTQPPSNPPQLPATTQTPTLTDSLLDTGLWTESERRQQQQHHHVEEDTSRPGRREHADGLTVPPPRSFSPSTHHSGLHSNYVSGSGPGQDERRGSNTQSPVVLQPEYGEKPTSPWRLTFGKNNHPGDGNKSGVAGHGKATGLREDYVAVHPGDNGKQTLQAPAASPLSPVPSLNGRDGNYQDETLAQQNHRPGKTRLNLLNPLALLARRRSPQSSGSKTDNVSINRLGLPALPDDYDPRIRGKLVHDFSVPRTRAHGSSNSKQQLQEKELPDTPEQPTSGNHDDPNDRSHESANSEHHESDLRVGSQTREGYIPPENEGLSKASTIMGDSAENAATTHQVEEGARPSSSSMEEKQQERPAATAITPPTEGATQTPSSFLSRSSTSREPSQAASRLPKHLHSSSSRFSFDMAGVESSSSQEKILEEKHKEKEAARKAQVQETGFYDSDSEDIDYSAMMDDDGLEERIPGVNAEVDEDDDDGEFFDHAHRSFMPTRPFVPVLPTLQSTPASPLDAKPPTQPSPEGGTQEVENGSSTPSGPQASTLDAVPVLQDTTEASIPQTQQQQPPPTNGNAQVSQRLTEDEFYFDDGMFDDISQDSSGEGFDESIFDDPKSHLYERKTRDPDNANVNDKPLPELPLAGRGTMIDQKENRPHNDDVAHGHSNRDDSQPLEGQNLTEGNLKAYHHALADAANQAALKGRFRRSTSDSEGSVERQNLSQEADSQPDLTRDQSRVSHGVDTNEDEDGLDDFDYNDTRWTGNDDDDAIIAAANAEVLEYDDDGYYGEEFGFYAYSRGPSDTEPVYGGYFGPRRAEGLSRSHSNHANFQEPSLTPITERSEWSTRNSIISLSAAHQGTHSNPSVSSPPLAQLVDMGSIEDEMSLAALRKLRRGAFGGSNGSLRSNAPSPTNTSSPQGQYQHHGSFSGSPSNSIDATACDQSLPPGGQVHSSSGMGDRRPSLVGEDGEVSSTTTGSAMKYDIPLASHENVPPPPLAVDAAKIHGSGVSGV